MGRWHDWRVLRFAAQRRLTRAAGISKVALILHSDTWGAVIDLCETAKMPLKGHSDAAVTRDDGQLEVTLSGVALVTILQATRYIWHEWDLLGLAPFHKFEPRKRAIAARVYLAIAQTVDTVEDTNQATKPIPPITIDDRMPAG